MFVKKWKKKKNLSSNVSLYFRHVLELRFHNPNRAIFGAESSSNFSLNKKKTKNSSFNLASSSPTKLPSVPRIAQRFLQKKRTNQTHGRVFLVDSNFSLGFMCPIDLLWVPIVAWLQHHKEIKIKKNLSSSLGSLLPPPYWTIISAESNSTQQS